MPESLCQQWDDYRERLSSLWWAHGIVFITSFLCGLFFLLFCPHENQSELSFRLFFIPYILSFAWLGYAYFRVYHFRCPHCDERFAYCPWKAHNPFVWHKCKHCGCEVGCEDEFFLDEESQAK